MSTPAETAQKLVEGVGETITGDAEYKANVAAEIVDKLIGNDSTALVRSIAGVPESLVETISDGLVSALRAQVLKRLSG